MITLLGSACAATLAAVSLLAMYQWLLAVAALLPRRGRLSQGTPRRSRLLVLIPAYDEENGITRTLRSLGRADYPRHLLRVVVIADRCTDRTAAVARGCGAECLERLNGPPGKGAAIAWAVHELRRAGAEFDGLVLIDADSIVDRGALLAFDSGLRAGHEVQQGYNYLSNPWASPFTRIIAATSVLRNGLFYGGKERLGLSSMLSGTGMCFSRGVLERNRWTAFSVGEDWEFSISLLLNGETIHFNRAARVRAEESKGFRQASRQRLRWASGRHGVAARCLRQLVREGWRRRRFGLWDAALTLGAPTYSAQASLVLLAVATAWFLADSPGWSFLLPWAGAVTGLLSAYLALGVALTDAPVRAVIGIALIPVFLPWRAAIELLGFLGFGRKQWVRTSRLSPSPGSPRPT